MPKEYTTKCDIGAYHSILMDGKKLKGAQDITVKVGVNDVTTVNLTLVIKAGSLKADGETIEFESI